MPSKKPKRITLPMFHLLLTLVDGESHGYAMGQKVRERSAGSVDLGPASLYWTINRLREAGFIEEISDGARGIGGRADSRVKGEKGVVDDAPADGRAKRRRYYRLTEAGRDTLDREADTWEQVLSFARSKNIGRQEAS